MFHGLLLCLEAPIWLDLDIQFHGLMAVQNTHLLRIGKPPFCSGKVQSGRSTLIGLVGGCKPMTTRQEEGLEGNLPLYTPSPTESMC